MKWNLKRLLHVFLWLPVFAGAQVANLKFSQFGTNEGLSASYVQNIYQDKQGFMWFATREGINKYDGYRFSVFKKSAAHANTIRSNDVKAMLQDNQHRLWLATTEASLNMLDLKKETFSSIKEFFPKAKGLSNNIQVLFQDRTGDIWAGSSDGVVYVMNAETGLFKQYNIAASVSAITEDGRGRTWIGTTAAGIRMIDNNGKVTVFKKEGTGLSDDHIKFIFRDRKQRLWAGTYGGGLNQYDPENLQFRKVAYETATGNDGKENFLLSMADDEYGNLWIGTENNGLSIYNPESGKTITYRHIDNDISSIGSNTINCIKQDAKGNMWLGTANAGLSLVNRDQSRFAHYKNLQNGNSLSNNIVNALFESSTGQIWIGTDGGGLNQYDPRTNTFKSYRHKPGNAASICGDFVLATAEDAHKNLWIGTWGNGITVFNEAQQHYEHFKNNPSDPTSLNSDYAFCLYKDSRNRMWVGTYGGGLDLYDETNHVFTHFVNNQNNKASISSNYILTITEDRSGAIWIGTEGGGLNRFNEDGKNFTAYTTGSTVRPGSDKLSNDIVTSIWEDKAGLLWLGTNYGLNRFDPEMLGNKSYFSEDGLPNDAVSAVIGDRNGRLWISTNKGLCRLNPQNNRFETYTVSDGLQADEFKNATCRDRQGRIYFGGKNGFNVFHPDSIKAIAYDPPLFFTNFQLANKDVKVAVNGNGPSPLKMSLAITKKIVLPYTQSSFAFEFASLNYTATEKKHYAYKMEGFDNQWHDIGTRNNVTFTNLDPGTYVLQVKGLRNDHKWSDQTAQIEIEITPPFWKTWWFEILAAAAIIGFIVLVFYLRMASIKKGNLQLKKEVRLRTRELSELNAYLTKSNENLEDANKEMVRKADQIVQQQEQIVYQNHQLEATVSELETSNKTKDKFFSILAHDLKNPISALSGHAELLKARLGKLNSNEISAYVNDIGSAARSIHNLVINVLDWAVTQSQNLQYQPVDLNLYQLLVKNIHLAQMQLTAKNIRCAISVDASYVLFADHAMVNTVFRNIISNSIKFTADGGQISITSKETPGGIAVLIRDTGVGMSAAQIERIKQRQAAGSSGTAGESGTGLGLQISTDFIQINKGTLEIESTPGTGSVFTITLPKGSGKEHPVETDVTQAETSVPVLENADGAPITSNEFLLPEIQQQALRGRRVLIIDDNPELRHYLKVFLSHLFEIVEAQNGVDGLRNAIELQPDLVITDLVMPVMNGLEFCNQAKNNISISHIPVVLLTGETGEQSQVSGYEAGADIYLPKPVNRQLLLRVIYNLINRQETIRKKYSAAVELIPAEIEYNKLDKEFLEKMTAVIEQQLSNYELDYKMLCEEAALSRTVLYAKFKTLTGMGVHDFIKNIRLKKSVTLLQEGRLNISQVAYEVGFATPSYFSKSFLKHYKCTPKEYIASLRKAASERTL